MSTQTPPRLKVLLSRIYTVEQLGVLLAVGDPPHRAWTEDEIAAAIRLRPDELPTTLHQLAKVPLLVRSATEDRWELLPDPETRQVVTELVKAYQENPVPVLRALSDNALERIRLAASRLLALRYGRASEPAGSPGEDRPLGGPDSMSGDAVLPSSVLDHAGTTSRNGPRGD